RDMEEVLDVLDAHWAADDVVSYRGQRARLAPAKNRLRPVQTPRPPVLLGGFSPAALDRVARRADGWMPGGLPLETIQSTSAQIRAAATDYGRDTDRMQLIVRANIYLTDAPIQGERVLYRGSLEQVIEDVLATAATGADEAILHLHDNAILDEALAA